MHHADFLEKISDEKIAAAIAEAEKKTTGRIRVYVSHHAAPDPIAVAHHRFDRLRMSHTPQRNAVLIFVAPKSQTFAVVGDQAVHEKCGEEFWRRLTAEMAEHFKHERWTEALVHGIHAIGDLLASHFPRSG